jgi:hypothetical protein
MKGEFFLKMGLVFVRQALYHFRHASSPEK